MGGKERGEERREREEKEGKKEGERTGGREVIIRLKVKPKGSAKSVETGFISNILVGPLGFLWVATVTNTHLDQTLSFCNIHIYQQQLHYVTSMHLCRTIHTHVCVQNSAIYG